MNSDDELGIPKGLSEKGHKAALIIRNYALEIKHDDPGGNKTFYTPEKWREREEDYGTDSVLVVVHDGGDIATIVSISSPYYDELVKRLDAEGMFIEQCTAWYSAVYAD